MDKVFDKWCEKLLDLGRGNRLINFKPANSRTVEIVAPYASTLFNKVKNGDKLSFYDVDSYVSEITHAAEEDDDDEYKFDETLLYGKKETDGLTLADIKSALEYRITKNQILAYKRGYYLKNILTNIYKSGKESLTEKGINILYLSFGFLKWTDAKDTYLSPLLLVPIKLENDNKRNPFYISLYEDEITTNPTLAFKLKAEQNLTIPEFDDEEHENETLMEYFLRVKEFAKNAKFEVLDNVYIGLFSFYKINMYNDLKTNENRILQNKNILRLLNKESSVNKVVPEGFIDKFFEEGKESNLHNVVDADASQTEAIVKALAGESFVLQGPPGTGKSQTITNLIAELLYNDKKVLFVSEKLTALKVVFNNLKKVGLSDFCLELHSNMANKKDVINELYRTLNLSKSKTADRAVAELEKLKLAKSKLDEYVTALHTKVAGVEKTPFEIFSELSELSNLDDLEFVFDNISSVTNEQFNLILPLLNRYKELTNIIQRDYRKNVWYGLNNIELTYQTKVNLKNNLKLCQTYFNDVTNLCSKINSTYNLNINNLTAFQYYSNLFNTICELTNLDNSMFDVGNLETLENLSTICESLETKIKENEKIVSETFTDKIYELNIATLRKNFNTKYKSIFRAFNANYKADMFEITDCLKVDKKLKYKTIVQILNLINETLDLRSKFQKALSELFGIVKRENVKSFASLVSDVNKLKTSLKHNFEPLINAENLSVVQGEIQRLCGEIKLINKNKHGVDNLSEMLDSSILDLTVTELNSALNKINGMIDGFDLVESYVKVIEVITKLKQLNVLEFLYTFLNTKNDISKISDYFKKEYYTQWAYYIIAKNSVLKGFDRISQDSAVKVFKEQDKLNFEIARAEIISKISSKRPNLFSASEGGEVVVLSREAKKVRKQMPVRKLLSEIPELVQILKPCFLMSPLSVSTYLVNDKLDFDVVIFDEASQIFPWDAIGSIYRAKQAIIVGDSKQMPPSNFFVAQVMEDGEFEENAEDDSLDFESILDLCASSFDESNLKWHYRSRDERLIAFSNKNYYNGNLVTFPATTLNKPDYGVQFVYVENGIFDRKTKTNLCEAQKIVDMVFDHFKTYPERSLGVVAFSISQQSLIERLIDKRRAKEPEFNKFFDDNLKEPFIVKNLESIQGDERDTIIFSVAYARDSLGKFLHNFGPLNQRGGERRLNVAITRAKVNVKLVASIKGYDIDLKRSSAEGVRLLKEYLDYAEAGEKMGVEAKEQTSSKIYTEIYEFLSSEGYDVDCDVGYSNFKIDLAVKSKNDPSKYVLAIECDGSTYKNQRTTRDRDRLRGEVLERMGWKYYRIWSIDWFLNKEVEKKKLLNALNKLENIELKIEEKTAPKKVEAVTDFLVNKSPEKALSETFKPYVSADTEDLKNQFVKGEIGFKGFITNVVKVEQPISTELLIKRVMVLYPTGRITQSVRSIIESVATIYNVDGFYVADRWQKIELRVPINRDDVRDISNVCIDELADGLYKIIELNIGINKEGLFKTLSKLLKYSRLTERISVRLNLALDSLISQNKVAKKDDLYFVVK